MTTYVAVFAMVLAYVALVAAYIALRTLAKLRRATAMLSRTERGERGSRARESLVEAAERQAAQTALVAEQVAQLRAYVDETCSATVASVQARADGQAGALRNVALVRYDAFSDMSGRMSFSLALLNELGDGVAISAIAGRADTRIYAKGVADGKGEHELSPEEHQAVTAALHKQRTGLLSRKAS